MQSNLSEVSHLAIKSVNPEAKEDVEGMVALAVGLFEGWGLELWPLSPTCQLPPQCDSPTKPVDSGAKVLFVVLSEKEISIKPTQLLHLANIAQNIAYRW